VLTLHARRLRLLRLQPDASRYTVSCSVESSSSSSLSSSCAPGYNVADHLLDLAHVPLRLFSLLCRHHDQLLVRHGWRRGLPHPGTVNARSFQGAAAATTPRRPAPRASPLRVTKRDTSWRARRKRGAPRGQPPRRHRGDLRVVRYPRQATEREHIAAGMKNAWSSQGAATTTTSRRPAPRASPPLSDRTRHIAAGTKNAQSSQGATATTTSRRLARRASPVPTKREHIAAGTVNARSFQGATATTTPQRPAPRASPAPSDQRVVHRPRRATNVSCIARAE
jgi:hypothetical protein